MKIILSPSKTMKQKHCSFHPQPLLFASQTNELYNLLKTYSQEQLAMLMKISSKQATQVYSYFHDSYNEYPALAYYTGTVFKQLDIDKYTDYTDYLDNHVCILSAYYGVLKYNTGIKPYRLDMTMKPEKMNLYEYWHTPIYQYFKDEDFIISLASKEFSDMVKHPHLYFIDFIELDNEKCKRSSMKVKKARGMMLHQMIIHQITTLKQLQSLEVDGYSFDPKYSHDHILAFTKTI